MKNIAIYASTLYATIALISQKHLVQYAKIMQLLYQDLAHAMAFISDLKQAKYARFALQVVRLAQH